MATLIPNRCSTASRLIQAVFLLSLLLGKAQFLALAQENAVPSPGASADQGNANRNKSGHPSVQNVMGKVSRNVYNSALAGKILPFLSKFSITSSSAKNILPELKK
eukprot:2037782-Ditylum_brightwellii.AAC.1